MTTTTKMTAVTTITTMTRMTRMTRMNKRTTKKTTMTDCTHFFKHAFFFPFTLIIYSPLVSSRLILVLTLKTIKFHKSFLCSRFSEYKITCHMQKGLFNLITHLLLLRFLTQQIKNRACRNEK